MKDPRKYRGREGIKYVFVANDYAGMRLGRGYVDLLEQTSANKDFGHM